MVGPLYPRVLWYGKDSTGPESKISKHLTFSGLLERNVNLHPLLDRCPTRWGHSEREMTTAAYIIETTECAVGVVVLQDDGYRFFACNPQAQSLDGRIFKSPAQAEREARRLESARATRRAMMRACPPGIGCRK
jgi:hypothetical protein